MGFLVTAWIPFCNSSAYLRGNLWKDFPQPALTLFVQSIATQELTKIKQCKRQNLKQIIPKLSYQMSNLNGNNFIQKQLETSLFWIHLFFVHALSTCDDKSSLNTIDIQKWHANVDIYPEKMCYQMSNLNCQ